MLVSRTSHALLEGPRYLFAQKVSAIDRNDVEVIGVRHKPIAFVWRGQLGEALVGLTHITPGTQRTPIRLL